MAHRATTQARARGTQCLLAPEDKGRDCPLVTPFVVDRPMLAAAQHSNALTVHHRAQQG